MKKIISFLLCVSFIIAVPVYAGAATDIDVIEDVIKILEIMTGDENGDMNLDKLVTRAEFAKMMISASVYKDSVGNGLSYSPFKDVKSSHWASGYIKTAVDAKWFTGYTDGTFRPESTITYEEGASALLKLLGYTTSALTGPFPGAQLTKFRALKLDRGVSPEQGRALTRNECMYFFYNLMGTETKNGEIYGTTLGYVMNDDDEIDYEELIKTEMEGPFVMDDGPLSALLPFEPEEALIYRNGITVISDAVGRYDVVYYDEGKKTVWAYSDMAVGLLTEISPNTVSPTAVTVGGNSYTLETTEVIEKLSVTGQFVAGDTVALLLGMNGTVVDVIYASEVDASYSGVITALELVTYPTGKTTEAAGYILSVACTDGVVRQCLVDGEDYSAGTVVTVSYAKGEVTISGTGGSRLSGKFSADGKKIGDYALSSDVQIMEVTKWGEWSIIYPSRLSGADIELGGISYYLLNDNNEICRLIVNDVTGDLRTYAVMTSVSEWQSDTSISMSGVYNYIVNGKAGVENTSTALYRVKTGGAIFDYEDGKISDIRNLPSISISELTQRTAIGDNRQYSFAAGLQVYIKTGSKYTQTRLSAINTDEYELTGYYDSGFAAGGRVRIIVAVKG